MKGKLDLRLGRLEATYDESRERPEDKDSKEVGSLLFECEITNCSAFYNTIPQKPWLSSNTRVEICLLLHRTLLLLRCEMQVMFRF